MIELVLVILVLIISSGFTGLCMIDIFALRKYQITDLKPTNLDILISAFVGIKEF